MLVRALFLLVVLSLPFQANASGYVVRRGDTLAAIARRFHVSVATLARANSIGNVNLIQAGRVLLIPPATRTFHYRRRIFYYHVRWGDSLLGLAGRFHLYVATIRSLNPMLGAYPLAGQWLKLCGPCWTRTVTVVQSRIGYAPHTATVSGSLYVVRPGDNVISIALRYGVSPGALIAANSIPNPNRISIGSRLTIPASTIPLGSGGYYNPWQARSLIVSYAQRYGIEPALPLAVGWQESGFNQSLISRTGAVGVMQVEPYTGRHIAATTGRRFNLYSVDDNVHAGVYWLAHLVNYYGGNERLAAAAYYQGTKSLGRYGFYQDTVQYVNDVMSLKSSFGD